MEIDSIVSPTSFDPGTSILINDEPVNDPILISGSTPIKVNKKRKISPADQQKPESEEESTEKSNLRPSFAKQYTLTFSYSEEFNQFSFSESSKWPKFQE